MKASKNYFYQLFTISQISEKYLQWLNDEETNRFSSRRFYKSTKEDAIKFINSIKPDEYMYAIYSKDKTHIGNIHLGPIDKYNLNCEIRILIGDKAFWNSGVATEAIYSAEKFLFLEKNIHRIGADSFNPAFEKVVVSKLGWRQEGVMKDRMLVGNQWFDYKIFGILKNEFRTIKELEI